MEVCGSAGVVFSQLRSLITRLYSTILAFCRLIWMNSGFAGSSEEMAKDHHPDGQTRLQEQIHKLQELSSFLLQRLNKVEREVQWLTAEVQREKVTWRERCQELFQQLREQCSPDEVVPSDMVDACNPAADIADGDGTPFKDAACQLHIRPGEQSHQELTPFPSGQCCGAGGQPSAPSSLGSCFSRPGSVQSLQSRGPRHFRTLQKHEISLRSTKEPPGKLSKPLEG
ncbi:uncharacterized protein LOC115073357 isoform X2 [Rhinatrema bivittatum]|uniref:uncharacterized protein LOC115073357 isoform X2 n=1 Tax=Rhinatrema bivittatum TaxID=194408 RepID=UPI00112D1B24|nr:uncharacterized protein LOC115073357 isoform X2 [Rhinatrema bivittatum]